MRIGNAWNGFESHSSDALFFDARHEKNGRASDTHALCAWIVNGQVCVRLQCVEKMRSDLKKTHTRAHRIDYKWHFSRRRRVRFACATVVAVRC